MKTFKLEFDTSCGCSLEKAESLNVDFAHGCNTRGAMASGVAAVVRKAYPVLASVDGSKSQIGLTPLGSFIRHVNRYSVARDRSFVYNFYTQTNPGAGSLSYSAIRNCFEKYFKTRLEERDHVKLIIPEIGCGLGGGFRLKVLHSIRKAFDSVEVPEGKSITVIMQIWGDGYFKGWRQLHHEMQRALTEDVDTPVEEVVARVMSSDNLLGDIAKTLTPLQILDYLQEE